MIDSHTILFEDQELLIINKPSGLLVHRGWGQDKITLVDLVRAYTGDATVHTVHRLDRATSGPVAFARSAPSARRLQMQFQAQTVAKHYIALVRGRAPSHVLVNHPMSKKPREDDRIPATTAYRRMHLCTTSQPRTTSLIEAVPRTGRTHQIRRHLKHISHPIIGDANYGKGPLNRDFATRYNLRRLALHCFQIALNHPTTNARIILTSPLPADLTQPLLAMGFPKDVWSTLGGREDRWFETLPHDA